jgi:hypothetical protein
VALLDVVRHETPGADARAFLLAHGVKSDKLTSAASAVLAGRMSEDKVLARLGIGGKPASSVAPKANTDPDGNAANEIYVEPVALAVNRPWRHAKVTDQRTCIDFAKCMQELVDVHHPEAERIRVVLDNLSAHSAAALYKPSLPRRRGGSSTASSFTSPPSMRAGSTWSRSRSA